MLAGTFATALAVFSAKACFNLFARVTGYFDFAVVIVGFAGTVAARGAIAGLAANAVAYVRILKAGKLAIWAILLLVLRAKRVTDSKYLFDFWDDWFVVSRRYIDIQIAEVDISEIEIAEIEKVEINIA